MHAGLIAFACVLVMYFLKAFFLDGLIKSRIVAAVERAYPEYSIRIAGLRYGVWKNRLECDSIELMKKDSTLMCSVARFSLNDVGRLQVLWRDGVDPGNFVSSDAEAEDIVVTFPRSQYELRCERLQVSVPDSEIVVDALEFRPLGDDEQFFAGSKIRRTRYRLIVSHCSVTGSACLRLLEGKIHGGRAAQIQNASLDLLVNKDKPLPLGSLQVLMPNEFLSSMMRTVQLKRLNIMNGQLKYSERYAPGSRPALLRFDSLLVLADIRSNRINHDDTLALRAQGILMQSGALDLQLSIPVASPEFTFRYSGSVRRMGLSSLNPFLEISEHKRFKTGLAHSVTFDIDVLKGSAKGTVWAMYKDLKISSIDGRTGSESGIGNMIASFFANNIKLRTTNMPDESGSMKIGNVNYRRKRDEDFFELAWSALRNGLGDIVGF